MFPLSRQVSAEAKVSLDQRIVTVQPKEGSNFFFYNVPIINAEEFKPHDKLAILKSLDSLLVSQEVDVVEAITGLERRNKYCVLDKHGVKLFNAIEESNCLQRCCCGASRPFSLKIEDEVGEEILHLDRPLRCGAFCCCMQELKVFSPPGNLIGVISESCSCLFPRYKLYDAMLPDTPLFEVKGPLITFSCFNLCGAVDFTVYMRNKQYEKVGFISKRWGGVLREFFTDSDTFGVSFPIDIEPKYKALFLAACFLIDYVHFERLG